MKFEKNSKYRSIALYAFLVIAASLILFFAMLYPTKVVSWINNILSILSPLIVGFLLAFILNPIMSFFEQKVFRSIAKAKPFSKRRRGLSLICTYLIFLGLITLFVIIVVPSLITSITDLINNLEGYYNKGTALLENFLASYKIPQSLLDPIDDIGGKIIDFTIDWMQNSLLPQLSHIAVTAISAVKNVVVGFAFSIYMLVSKETFARQFTKVIKTFFKEKGQNRIFRVGRLANQNFSGYLSGYLVDSFIVGVICYIVMRIFSWPYPELISILIGVCNMIPFFGPFIAGIPSALLIFMVNPWQAIFFTIFIVVLQQIDGNFFCPRILGQKVGLPSFWVMIAIVIGGSVFGIAGMVLSVPAFSVIYTLMRSFVNRKAREKEPQSSALEKAKEILESDDK